MSVYLDFNATTPLKPHVREAMAAALDIYGNPSSTHQPGRGARLAVDTARRQVAELLGVRSEQVVFAASGSEANNMVLRGACLARPGKRLLVSAVEHSCIARTAEALAAAHQVPVTVLPVDRQGLVRLDALESALQAGDVGLVAVMHANNETGVIQPIEDITALVHAHGAAMHVDAVQTVGKLPVDFTALGADSLVLSFHKLGGPKGVAAVIQKGGFEMLPHTTGGSQERGRRAGTENTLAIVGAGACAASLPACLQDMPRLAALQQCLEAGLKRLANDIIILGEDAPRVANTTGLIIPGLEGETAMVSLDLEGFAVATGSACSSGRIQPSRVLLAQGYTEAEAVCALRISTGWLTQEGDIHAFLAALERVLARCRKG